MSDLFDQDDIELEDSLFELFFSDGAVELSEEDGLIWKEVLREGTWAFRPGAGGRPVPIPLKVVAGTTDEKGQIGMSDLIDAFDDGAVDHVTVPTTHEDKPQDNTGYVKKLRIEGTKGKKRLMAAIDFTEPDIKEKTERGSIAGTSCGIMFDYVKKDSGKKYGKVLGHVALTNKPWINGMKPFGIAASENYSEDNIESLVFEDVVWDSNKSANGIRSQVQKALHGTGFFVADVHQNRALVNRFDDGAEDSVNYVVPFKFEDGDVKLPAQDSWIKATQEWVKASQDNENFMKDLQKNFENQGFSEEEAPNRGAKVSDPEHLGGKSMGSEKTDEKNDTPGATSDPAPEAVLSEDARNELKNELRTEFEEAQANLSEENKTLRNKVHAMSVEARIAELEDSGFKDAPGLLAEIRTQMLADDGQPALVLSEQSDGETKEVSLSVSESIERIIQALPKSDDGRVNFADQALSVEDHSAPPAKPNNGGDNAELSEDERIDALAEGLGKTELVTKESSKDGDN